MKVRIDTDEWYPYHYLTDSDWGIEVDVPQSTIDRWNEVEELTHKVQIEMMNLYDEAKKAQALENAKKNGRPSIGF